MSYKDKYQGVTSVQIGGSSLWFVLWLFTIGFAELGFCPEFWRLRSGLIT